MVGQGFAALNRVDLMGGVVAVGLIQVKRGNTREALGKVSRLFDQSQHARPMLSAYNSMAHNNNLCEKHAAQG